MAEQYGPEAGIVAILEPNELQEGVRQFDDLVIETIRQQADRLGVSGIPLEDFRWDGDFDAMVRIAIEAMPDFGNTAYPIEGLTPAEIDALGRGGFTLQPFRKGIGANPVFIGAAEHAAILVTSMRVPKMAQELDIGEYDVQRMLERSALYGIHMRGEWRIPRFQFEHHKPLPGIEVVMPQLDPTLDPVGVYRWFTLPSPDLVIGDDDTAVSPQEWLRTGGDPTEVAVLAAAL